MNDVSLQAISSTNILNITTPLTWNLPTKLNMPLKFVIRTSDTSYPLVNGHRRLPQQETHHDSVVPRLLRHRRYFPVQICSTDSSYNIHNTIQVPVPPFCGCCDREKSRMILLREKNFVACCAQWDLYVVLHDKYHHHQQQQNYPCSTKSIETVPYQLLSMALVPWSYQVEQQECRQWPWWTFVGTCYASTIRLDMEAVLSFYFHKNDPYRHYNITSENYNTCHYHPYVETKTSSSYHWHVEVYMDQIVDESYLCISQSTCPISISYQSILNGPIIDNSYVENNIMCNDANEAITSPTAKEDDTSACTGSIQEVDAIPTSNNILSTSNSNVRKLKKIRRKKRQEYSYSMQNTNLDLDEKENMTPNEP
jgi:hypothetical protein